MKMEQERQDLGRKRLTITAYREKRHRIFHLLRQGLTYVEVAREVNLSPRRIGQIAARGGVRRALSWKVNEAVTLLVARKRDTPDRLQKNVANRTFEANTENVIL